MSIKSLQIIRRFSLNAWGGSETVLWNCSQRLAAKDCPTEILATSALWEEGTEVRNNVPIKHFPYSYMRMRLSQENKDKLDQKGGDPYSLPMFRYIKSQKCDILHCHSMERIAKQTNLAARLMKIPYVLTLHGQQFIHEEECLEMAEAMRGTIDYGWTYDMLFGGRRYLSQASGILCVSHDQVDNMKRRFPDKIVQFMPNGVNTAKFHADPEKGHEFKEKYGIDPQAEVILCVSRIDYTKNQEIIIELLKKLLERGDNAHVVIMGNVTSPHYMERIKSKIKMYGLESKVVLIEGISTDDPDLVNAYAAASCFILPSVHEPFGIVCLEAWASGLPVIASKVGGLEKLITERETGLFFENNSLNMLIEKYDLYRKSNSLRQRIIENASREVHEKYSWNILVDQLIDFYERVIQNYHSRRRGRKK